MTDNQIVKAWREKHDVYATLDNSPTTHNKIILIKDNNILIKEYDVMSIELLDLLLEEFMETYR